MTPRAERASPVLGEIVHYQVPFGVEVAAVVVEVDGPAGVRLKVFAQSGNDYLVPMARRGEPGQDGTWHPAGLAHTT